MGDTEAIGAQWEEAKDTTGKGWCLNAIHLASPILSSHKGTMTQRGKATLLRSHSFIMAQSGLEQRLPDFFSCAFSPPH